MEIGKKKLAVIIAAAFLAGAAITGGACAAVFNGLFGYVTVSESDYEQLASTYDRFGKLNEIYDAAEESYYKEIDEEAVMDSVYKGFVSGLGDPYSSYFTAEEYDNWTTSVTGKYSGVGITFSEGDDGNFVVISVEPDSPAEEGGIRAGDVILAVDGKEYDDLNMMGCAIRGEENTRVSITYSRNGSKKDVTLVRKEISQHSVQYEMLDGSTGYIQISSFMEETADEFKEAMTALEEKGADRAVIDLRDNGGGLVDSCVEIADEFLDEGLIVYMEDKEGNRKEYKAEDGKTSMKVVVLVNENSASAAEILAAALQDNGIKLVGNTTYGKGVVQSTAEFEDGTALKLTIMQYFSPDGNAINEVGIEPDYKVENPSDSDEDKQLEKALSLF